MSELTSIERVRNTFEFKPVDRIGYQVQPWKTTVKKWLEQGLLEEGEDVCEHFGCDISGAGWFNAVANLDFEEVVLEEDDHTRLTLDGNGAKLRRHIERDGTPEHVDFEVNTRRAWEDKIKPFLLNFDRRRIDCENYGKEFKLASKDKDSFAFVCRALWS